MSEIIYEGTPSLPHTFNYTPDDDQEVILYFSGTAWSKGNGQKIGLSLSIDGSTVVTTHIYSNATSVHRTLVAGLAKYTFPFKMTGGQMDPVSIVISALNAETNFDTHDMVSVCIL